VQLEVKLGGSCRVLLEGDWPPDEWKPDNGKTKTFPPPPAKPLVDFTRFRRFYPRIVFVYYQEAVVTIKVWWRPPTAMWEKKISFWTETSRTESKDQWICRWKVTSYIEWNVGAGGTAVESWDTDQTAPDSAEGKPRVDDLRPHDGFPKALVPTLPEESSIPKLKFKLPVLGAVIEGLEPPTAEVADARLLIMDGPDRGMGRWFSADQVEEAATSTPSG
jgi:hypothetical protein